MRGIHIQNISMTKGKKSEKQKKDPKKPKKNEPNKTKNEKRKKEKKQTNKTNKKHPPTYKSPMYQFRSRRYAYSLFFLLSLLCFFYVFLSLWVGFF
jgi:hypothetical protein